jgi:hypothetical protein
MKRLDLQPEASGGAANFPLPEPIGLSFKIIRKILDKIVNNLCKEKHLLTQSKTGLQTSCNCQ